MFLEILFHFLPGISDNFKGQIVLMRNHETYFPVLKMCMPYRPAEGKYNNYYYYYYYYYISVFSFFAELVFNYKFS